MLLRLLLACLVLATGCTRGGDTFGPAKRARTGNTFYVGSGAEPESIDPGKVYDASGFMVSRNLFEGLMRPDPVTLKALPGVAESYEESADGTHFVFRIREGARWSDGSPVTAGDFEWAWKRVLAPETAAQYAALLWDLKGGKAFAEGRGSREDVGVKALDDRTLEVTLERPIPWFLELLTFGPFQPVPRHAIERHGMEWTRPENIVTNGPFHLDRWVINYQIEIARSPTYWGRDEVRLDRVVFVVSDDNHAMMRLFRAGELDWIGPDVRPPQEYLEHLAGKKDFRTNRDLATYFYLINLRQDTPAQRASPLQDKRVRKALDMSVDKDAIVRFVTRGGERPATNLVPHLFNEDGYLPPPGNPYDPEAARRLLAEAGWGPGGKPFPRLEILYNTHDAHRQVAEALQGMWKKELGIDVQIVNQEW
ncbi:MAG TPA: peptide ABC transporter substrate-binding protein, partial [Vulgatibacter sp.]